MSIVNYVAVLGAAAWLPQILQWIYSWIVKPTVTIFPDRAVGIGYAAYGPIFNVKLSIDIDKKDRVIDFLKVELSHESGTKHIFEWAIMMEAIGTVKNNKIGDQIIQRDNIPICIKLNLASLFERTFQFLDEKLTGENKNHITQLLEKCSSLEMSLPGMLDRFLKSDEVKDYLARTKSNLYWQAGSYTVKFYVHSTKKIKQNIIKYKFELTQYDIEQIKQNLEAIEHIFEAKPCRWSWIYPSLTKML